MTLSARLATLPRNVTPRNVRTLKESTTARESLLQQIVEGFERKYGTSLEVFEARLARGQAPEHPGWEDSIEWRNAVETNVPIIQVWQATLTISTMKMAAFNHQHSQVIQNET